MQTYQIATTISSDRTLTIKELPFQAGDKVQVIVRIWENGTKRSGRYPLRGKPIRYVNPFGSVAESDWNVLQ
ncbi:MAG: hypothetical protein V3S14_08355 [Anaerolineae bacterium]